MSIHHTAQVAKSAFVYGSAQVGSHVIIAERVRVHPGAVVNLYVPPGASVPLNAAVGPSAVNEVHVGHHNSSQSSVFNRRIKQGQILGQPQEEESGACRISIHGKWPIPTDPAEVIDRLRAEGMMPDGMDDPVVVDWSAVHYREVGWNQRVEKYLRHVTVIDRTGRWTPLVALRALQFRYPELNYEYRAIRTPSRSIYVECGRPIFGNPSFPHPGSQRVRIADHPGHARKRWLAEVRTDQPDVLGQIERAAALIAAYRASEPEWEDLRAAQAAMWDSLTNAEQLKLREHYEKMRQYAADRVALYEGPRFLGSPTLGNREDAAELIKTYTAAAAEERLKRDRLDELLGKLVLHNS